MIQPFHQRMAELWVIEHGGKYARGRTLTVQEHNERDNCLTLNMGYVHELSVLQNYSIMAHETNDVEWQHDICKQIEEFEHSFYNTTKKRSNAQEHSTNDNTTL